MSKPIDDLVMNIGKPDITELVRNYVVPHTTPSSLILNHRNTNVDISTTILSLQNPLTRLLAQCPSLGAS